MTETRPPELAEAASSLFDAVPIHKTVNTAWTAVMNDVQVVAKNEFAKVFGSGSGGFKFRGVDAVVDAVGPALRAHGVAVVPKRILRIDSAEYETKGGAKMVNKQVTVEWEVRGPAGDSFTGETVGEAADSGDKAMSKAQSVAFRVFLLQALCIPTGERDPEYEVHERSSGGEGAADPQAAVEVTAATEARRALLRDTEPLGWDQESLMKRFWDDYQKNLRNTRDVELIQAFGQALWEEGPREQESPKQIEAPPPEQAEPPQPPQPRLSEAQLRKLNTLLSRERITGHDARVQWCSDALGVPVDSTKDLTPQQANRLIDKLDNSSPEGS